MQKVEASHGFVGHLWIDAHHLWVLQRFDESERTANGGQIDITARLIGLGFQRKTQIIALIAHVFC